MEGLLGFSKDILQSLLGASNQRSLLQQDVPPEPMEKPDVPIGSDLLRALNIASEKGKGKPLDIYNKVIVPMAYHESAGTMSPSLEQFGGGLGRGVLQFEPQRMKVALQRTVNLLGERTPAWVKKARKEKNYDATSLTQSQQMALAVYDLLEKPGADIAKVTKGEQDIEDFWLKHWWAGKDKDAEKRKKSFKESMRRM